MPKLIKYNDVVIGVAREENDGKTEFVLRSDLRFYENEINSKHGEDISFKFYNMFLEQMRKELESSPIREALYNYVNPYSFHWEDALLHKPFEDYAKELNERWRILEITQYYSNGGMLTTKKAGGWVFKSDIESGPTIQINLLNGNRMILGFDGIDYIKINSTMIYPSGVFEQED